jgi:hypothetical protein
MCYKENNNKDTVKFLGQRVPDGPPTFSRRSIPAKKEVTKMRWIKAVAVVLAVFAPFIMVGYALAIVPTNLIKNLGGVDWLWLVMLGLMMVGTYYFLAVYVWEEDEIYADFVRLDADHDGYISRADATSWKRLAREFDKFDLDRDGKLSRIEFEEFEHSLAH